MTTILYASSAKNSDMRYVVKIPIPDAFFLIDQGDKKCIFLDKREFDVFTEANQVRRLNAWKISYANQSLKVKK